MFQILTVNYKPSGCSTVAEHLPHYPKVKGLSSTTAVGTAREKMSKNSTKRSSLPHL